MPFRFKRRISAVGCLFSICARGEEASADLVLYNARVITMTSTNDVLSLADADTHRIDAGRRTILPGFIDPHTHLLNDSWLQGLSPIEAQVLALRNGITTSANLYTTPDGIADSIELAQAGDLRVRFSLYLIDNTSCGDVLGNWYRQYEPLADIAPRLSIGGVKIFAETSVCEDRPIGISFTEPLRNTLSPAGREWYGDVRPLLTAEELERVVRDASQAGFPVAIHAIGDGGVQVSLDAISDALDGGPNVLWPPYCTTCSFATICFLAMRSWTSWPPSSQSRLVSSPSIATSCGLRTSTSSAAGGISWSRARTLQRIPIGRGAPKRPSILSSGFKP